MTWLKTIERDLNSIGVKLKEAIEVSQNREQYHNDIVVRAMDEALEQFSSADADEM